MSKAEILLIVFAISFFVINILAVGFYENRIRLRQQLEEIEIKKYQAVTNKQHLKLIDKFTRKNT